MKWVIFSIIIYNFILYCKKIKKKSMVDLFIIYIFCFLSLGYIIIRGRFFKKLKLIFVKYYLKRKNIELI